MITGACLTMMSPVRLRDGRSSKRMTRSGPRGAAGVPASNTSRVSSVGCPVCTGLTSAAFDVRADTCDDLCAASSGSVAGPRVAFCDVAQHRLTSPDRLLRRTGSAPPSPPTAALEQDDDPAIRQQRDRAATTAICIVRDRLGPDGRSGGVAPERVGAGSRSRTGCKDATRRGAGCSQGRRPLPR